MKSINKKNKMLVIVVLLMGFVNVTAQSAWVAPESADTISNPLKNDQTAIKEGKKLFTSMCVICHGNKGKGDGVAGAALSPRPANFSLKSIQDQTDGALFWKLTNGKAPMASYKELLTETQRWQLVNYLRTFKNKQ